MDRQQPDPYAVLGVAPDATQAAIGHAYRTLLRRHHPDTRDQETATTSDAALQQVLGAYALLRDAERRAAYDREHAPRRQSAGGGTPSLRTPSVVNTQAFIRVGPVRWWPATTPRGEWW